MRRVEGAFEPRRAAEALGTLKTAQIERARSALDTLSQRAKEARARARSHAAAQLDRGRSAAADRLETIIDALRPLDPRHAARSRRKAAVIAGGGGVALLAAIGLGVGLGMMLSKRLRQKAQVRERLTGAETQSEPATPLRDPTTGAAAPVVY